MGSQDKNPRGRNPPKVLRPLSNIETFQSARYLVGQWSAIATTCRYAIPDRLAASENNQNLIDAFDNAVSRTVIDQPMLQVAQADEDSKRPSWIQLESIDLAQHIQWTIVPSSQDFDTAFESSLQVQAGFRFPDLSARPGWGIEVVRPEHGVFMEVIFAWHHSYTDGMGSRIFLEDLLRKLNSPSPDGKLPTLKDRVLKLGDVSQNFIPPLEKLGKFTVSPGYSVVATWRGLRPAALASGQSTVANWAPIRLSPTKTQIRSLSVEDVMLQSVLDACRKNNTTLTGLVHGIVLISLAEQLPEEQAAGFEATTSRDMRHSLPQKHPKYPWVNPMFTVGVLVSHLEHNFDPRRVKALREAIRSAQKGPTRMDALAEHVWSVAADARVRIRQDQELGLKNNVVGLLGIVGDWRARLRANAEKPRTNSWAVNNLGVLDGGGERRTGWAINGARFTCPSNVIGSAIQICVVTVKGQRLAVDVTWQDGVVDIEIGERVAADIEAWLNYLGGRFRET